MLLSIWGRRVIFLATVLFFCLAVANKLSEVAMSSHSIFILLNWVNSHRYTEVILGVFIITLFVCALIMTWTHPNAPTYGDILILGKILKKEKG